MEVGRALLEIRDASMGPPLFSGGNWVLHYPRGTSKMASMGPPLFSGGNQRIIEGFAEGL